MSVLNATAPAARGDTLFGGPITSRVPGLLKGAASTGMNMGFGLFNGGKSSVNIARQNIESLNSNWSAPMQLLLVGSEAMFSGFSNGAKSTTTVTKTDVGAEIRQALALQEINTNAVGGR